MSRVGHLVEVFDGYQALFRPLAQPAIAFGNFDGVHRGHQALLGATRAAADRLGGDAVVYTFDPHPARLLAPAAAPKSLTTLDRKLELLQAAGMSVCVLEPFTAEFAQMSAQDFLNDVVGKILGDELAGIDHRPTLAAAQERIESGPVDLLLLDLDLHGEDGFEVLRRTSAAYWRLTRTRGTASGLRWTCQISLRLATRTSGTM